MPPNKKRNRRNKAATQGQTQSAQVPKTIPCHRCGEEIIVPKACKHGKKLINCQGTGCTTAHIDEHNANCRLAAPFRPSTMPQRMQGTSSGTAAGLREPEPIPVKSDLLASTPDAPVYGSWVTGPPNGRLTDLLKSFPSTRTVAMGHLSEQLTRLRAHRGKLPRYIQGVPLDEWFNGLEEGSILQVTEWTEKLRDLVEGKKTAEEIGYDDDDTDDEGDACPTPEEE
ncbi:uncharacterized protein Z519_11914 [Cladophialophora bantiana CBS 173.52]|uniref:Uncharacterized protein n=1 Tax=Cladophialophora bantiana (strain ATCC 10958 / CBS 173.52 / CDC B-1940 / NIH 8579) TaxID=1442370 RepID=A0A0D2HT34_CLAB1|nr:uncharacterized protein Z519_11914 [Cladophialophora bantiana CBS 173.52]KIW87589.1 hypothetical protein Z519_11914 [Cladophialophora bantiana CBS 173.52]